MSAAVDAEKIKTNIIFYFCLNDLNKSFRYLLTICECRICEIQTLNVADTYRLVRPPRNGSIQEVRPDMAARPAAAASTGTVPRPAVRQPPRSWKRREV